MGPNRSIVFMLDDHERFGGFEHMPKGELMHFAVNPYNGKVVLRFQDRHENGPAVIEAVLTQLLRDLRLMRMKDREADLRMLADYLDGELEMDLSPQVVRVDKRMPGRARKAV